MLFPIEVGDWILVPAVRGRKSGKLHQNDYAEIVSITKNQRGKVVVMVEQANRQLLFDYEELQSFWNGYSGYGQKVVKRNEKKR